MKKAIDNKPKNKHIEHNRQMEGQKVNPYLLQEPEHFNKPAKLIKQVIDTPLTVRQKKIYSFCLRELLKEETTTNEIDTTVKDLLDFLGVQNKNDIKADLRKLAKTTIIIEEEESNKTTEAQLLSGHTMPKDQENSFDIFRTLTIRFDTRLTKVLKEIYSYAKLDLTVLKKLNITHSITLYEIFKRRLIKVNAGKINLSEADLRKYLNLEDKYLEIKAFNRELKKWIKDIESNSNMSITYENKKHNKENIYHFIVSDFIALPFSTFKKKIVNIKNISDLIFKYQNKEYCLMQHSDNSSKDIENLFIMDYQKYMTYGSKEHLSNYEKNFTLNKEEAKTIWEYLYNQFLENQYLFLYKFFILRDMDKEIKSISTIDYNEIIEEKLSQYFDHFSTEKK